MNALEIGTEHLERCAFCGLNVESPCDTPPAMLCQTVNDTLLAQQTELEAERKLFEDAAYVLFEQKREAGKLDMSDGGDGSREALFWKQPNGEYGVLMFNAAWWAWKAAKGLK